MDVFIQHKVYMYRTLHGTVMTIIWAASRQNQQTHCAPSEDSDEPGHPPSRIRVFACAQWVVKDPSFLQAGSKDSDQTGRMSRLIWVSAGRTCHFVGFVMRRLKWLPCSSTENLKNKKKTKKICTSLIFSLSGLEFTQILYFPEHRWRIFGFPEYF